MDTELQRLTVNQRLKSSRRYARPVRVDSPHAPAGTGSLTCFATSVGASSVGTQIKESARFAHVARRTHDASDSENREPVSSRNDFEDRDSRAGTKIMTGAGRIVQ